MRKRFILIVIFLVNICVNFVVAETVQDVVLAIQEEGVYDPYFDTYINMARLKKVPDEQLLRVMKIKKEYLLFVKSNYKQFSKQMIPYILYFSDIGILQENIPMLKHQESVQRLLPEMKDLLTVLSVTFAASEEDLNDVFISVCKYYSAEDVKIVATHIRQQHLKSAGTHTRRIQAMLVQHLKAGSSIKLILRNLREVTQ